MFIFCMSEYLLILCAHYLYYYELSEFEVCGRARLYPGDDTAAAASRYRKCSAVYLSVVLLYCTILSEVYLLLSSPLFIYFCNVNINVNMLIVG